MERGDGSARFQLYGECPSGCTLFSPVLTDFPGFFSRRFLDLSHRPLSLPRERPRNINSLVELAIPEITRSG